MARVAPGLGFAHAWRRLRNHTAGRRRLLAAVVVAVLTVPALVAGIAPAVLPSSHDGPGTDDDTTGQAMQDLQRLVGALPESLTADTVLGPAAGWLSDEGTPGADDPALSGSVAAIGRMLMGDSLEPVPVPPAPTGPDPMLVALDTFAEATGTALPDHPVLKAEVAALRLTPEAEQALSRLVLAYSMATRLEQDSLRDLSPEEINLINGNPDTVSAWLAQDPSRDATAYQATVEELRTRIHLDDRIRAADLLVRTMEQVKGPLAVPPAPPVGAGDGPATASVWSTDDWPTTGDPDFDRINSILASGLAPATDGLPDLPDETLVEAMGNLLATLGVPSDDPLYLPQAEALPPSLADAVAGIVTARRVGLESGDAAAQSLLMLEATRQARPTLEAWAALLELDAVDASVGTDAIGTLQTALMTGASPSQYLSTADPDLADLDIAVPMEHDLIGLLQDHGLSAADAAATEATLPPHVAAGLAHALWGLQRIDAARDAALSGLDPQDRQVITSHTDRVHALLETSSWTAEEAELVQAWAGAMERVGPDGMQSLHQARADAVATVEAAVAVMAAGHLADAAPDAPESMHTDADAPTPGTPAGTGGDEDTAGKKDSWLHQVIAFIADFQIIGTATAQVPEPPVPGTLQQCRNIQGLSNCDKDIWFQSPSGPGILITGYGSTTIGPADGVTANPAIAIDLGGDDTYQWPVGSASGFASARVAIDMGGDDDYTSLSSALAHGAADGFSSLGLLWDNGGNDLYEITCDGVCGAQGYGTNDGLGILLDGAGHDTYRALDSTSSQDARAHGVGWNGGTGVLLDHGAGDDTFITDRGQGHGHGNDALGILVNDGAGTNAYGTSIGNTRYQGGHQVGTSATGVLVDMSGKDTVYGNVRLPEGVGTVYHAFDTEEPTRTDDAMWAEATVNGGFGIGLDSTTADDDDDGFPNVVELAGLSDPQDGGSEPGLGTLGPLVDQVTSLLPDSDGDPTEALEGFQFRDDLLCEEGPEVEDPSQCTSLVHIGGTGDDTFTLPAHILIELGGDDTYEVEVAGPGDFWGPDPLSEDPTTDNTRYPGVGSIAIDLSGNDVYQDSGGPTQGAVRVGGLDGTTEQGNLLSSVSLLLDLSGDDTYEATEASQGAADAIGNCLAMNNPGEAWLVDLGGADNYTSSIHSQGYVTDSAGRAGLIDLRGADTYEFERQAEAERGDTDGLTGCASVRQVEPLALLYDGGGQDRYMSRDVINFYQPWETPTFEERFRSQGTGPEPQRRGINGPIQAYWEFGRGVFIDEGGQYDDYLLLMPTQEFYDASHLKNNATHLDVDGDGDGQTLAAQNLDGQGWRLTFIDRAPPPVDANQHQDPDGDGAPNGVEDGAGTNRSDPDDQPGTVWSDPVGGASGDDAWLRLPGSMVIGGRGDSVHEEAAPFLIDLGGQNAYEAASIGGSNAAGQVTLLLDVGADTTYSASEGCASLGGATGGIAVLGDAGGTNTFQTDADDGCTAMATQGASTGGAVGVLVTWDAADRFDAADSTVPLFAQGASFGGLGVLAALGSDDHHFQAPDGTAQGHGSGGGTGLLWSGTGDDRFDAGAASQGSATGQGSIGLLVDRGGNDRYILTAPATGPAVSQGAASGDGSGVLVDVAGDDRYIARGHGVVQGAGASGGGGTLLDGGGHDRYVAADEAQGYASESGSHGLLVDAGGRDRYRLETSDGLGRGGGDGCSIFIDAGGRDRYPPNQEPRNDNEWGTVEACNGGADTSGLDEAVAAAAGLGDAMAPLDVDLQVFADGTLLRGGGTVEGDLLLRALVKAAPPGLEQVDRVAFLANNEVVGHGTFVGTEGGRLVYEYLWRTPSASFPEAYPDGVYTLRASAFYNAEDDGGAGSPDAAYVDSPSRDLSIDNPTLVVAELERTHVSPAMGVPIHLNVSMGHDLDPDGSNLTIQVTPMGSTEPVFADTQMRAPGAYEFVIPVTDDGNWTDGSYSITVQATDQEGHESGADVPGVFRDGVRPDSWITTPVFAGLDHLNASGLDESGSGTLRLTWNHTDAAGSGVQETCVLRFDDADVDATTPMQVVSCHGPEGPMWKNITGVETDDVFHLATVAVDQAGNQESPCLGEDPLGDGTCYLAKASGAINITNVTMDLHRPVVGPISVLADGVPLGGGSYRPGTPINFTADVTDTGSGAARVQIRLSNTQNGGVHDFVASMEPGDDGLWYYSGWGGNNSDLDREEELQVTVTAWDRAGNAMSDDDDFRIDGAPPRVTPQPPFYFSDPADPDGTSMEVGEPGAFVALETIVRDRGQNPQDNFSVAGVHVNASALGIPAPVPCTTEIDNPPFYNPPFWTCEVFQIPNGTMDGDYFLPFNATDDLGNTNTADGTLIEVRNQTLELISINATPSHDGFQVTWQTDFEGTSTVLYGLSPSSATTEAGPGPDGGYRTDHTVTVAGLAPAKDYYFHIVSEGRNGLSNTSSVHQVRTLHTFDFQLTGPSDGEVVGGDMDVRYDVGSRTDDEPVEATLWLQDATGATNPPYELLVDTFEMTPGQGSRIINTTAFPQSDLPGGEYRLHLLLERPGETLDHISAGSIHLDNMAPIVVPTAPRPESTIADPTPLFNVTLIDHQGLEPPLTETLRVHVDGVEVPDVDVVSDVVTDATHRRVEFRLPDDRSLSHGEHVLTVEVGDPAGNTGQVEWRFRVDLEPPEVVTPFQATPLPGPDAAKPGDRIQVEGTVHDASNVAAVWVNGTLLGAEDPMQLFATGDGQWTGTLDIPETATNGTHAVPIIATDHLGNNGTIGHMDVPVDAHPPEATASVQATGYTWATVRITTDEPTRATVAQNESAASDAWRAVHDVRIDGLDPGQEHAVNVSVVDRAGHVVAVDMTVTTSDDTDPPAAVGNLTASTAKEGEVVLAWDAPSDNAGISHYRLQRSEAPRAAALSVQLGAGNASYMDHDAPAGRTVTYAVVPVDVAGLAGPATEATVGVLADPQLWNVTVTPMRGTSDEPFTFRVDYRHAGDRAPDAITLHVQGQSHALGPVDGDQPCHEACTYQVDVLMSPSSLFDLGKKARIDATTDNRSASITIEEMPFVVRGDGDGETNPLFDFTDTDGDEGRSTPFVGAIPLLAVLAAAAFMHSRRRLHP